VMNKYIHASKAYIFVFCFIYSFTNLCQV
jgi:hypothetical protein